MEYLYLNDNLISELPENSFDGLRCLKMLNLGGNFLRNISNTWFRDLGELEVLYLDRNRINYIEDRAFENLTSLVALHLNSNNLTTLPFSVFQPVYFLGRLYLFRNPWECDCRIEWLKEWMENYRLVRDISCASPSSVAGIDLMDVLYKRSPEGYCLDPVELNITSEGPTPSEEPWSTTESKFNSFISKLLLQMGLSEEVANTTEVYSNTTQLDGLTDGVSSGVGEDSMEAVSFSFYLPALFTVIVWQCK